MNYKDIERSIIKTYRKDIWCKFTKAVTEYDLIKENDKIAVCISGGKDSFLMAKCFEEIRKHGKYNFDLEFIVMDPGYSSTNLDKVINNAKLLNIPIKVFKTDIFESVKEMNTKSPCYMCARMRRGHLYSIAKELGCNKIALGHHFDDVIETILMSIFYNGEVRSMLPKLHSENFQGMELIRPLYFIKESSIINWVNYNNLEFINCACILKNDNSKRQEIKSLISLLRKNSKYIDLNIFKSVENINLNQVIGYFDKDTKHYFLDDYDK
ncbi:MAG: ATP-binding protein [Bacilli bacterium]